MGNRRRSGASGSPSPELPDIAEASAEAEALADASVAAGAKARPSQTPSEGVGGAEDKPAKQTRRRRRKAPDG